MVVRMPLVIESGLFIWKPNRLRHRWGVEIGWSWYSYFLGRSCVCRNINDPLPSFFSTLPKGFWWFWLRRKYKMTGRRRALLGR
jgi:hypothetical protein